MLVLHVRVVRLVNVVAKLLVPLLYPVVRRLKRGSVQIRDLAHMRLVHLVDAQRLSLHILLRKIVYYLKFVRDLKLIVQKVHQVPVQHVQLFLFLLAFLLDHLGASNECLLFLGQLSHPNLAAVIQSIQL